MTNKTDTNKKKFLKVLEKALGVVSTACEKANISRTSVYEWMEKDANFKADVDTIRNEVCVDFAESRLFKQIDKGSTAATIFFLKTRGKHRGYIEKQEIETTHKGGLSIEFDDIEGDNLKD